MADGFTISCKMGTFTFDKNVMISKAKRIRDEVMGQFFDPKAGLPRLRTERDIESFVRNAHHLKDVSDVPFEVRIS